MFSPPALFSPLAPPMKSLSLLPININFVTHSQRWDLHPFLPTSIPDDLVLSFKELGILQPPILYEQSGGQYEILSGRRRILAAREICHLTECFCLVVPHTTPPHEVFSLLFESHRFSSPFSPMETAYFLSIGLQYLSLAELAQTFLLKMTGKSSVSILRKFLQLLLLEKEIQQLVHSLFITESMALDLLKISPEDRSRLSRLFRDFQLGGGKQKRLFMLLRDICQRKKTSISIFLERQEIAEILRHREMNNPQKIQKLLSLLQQMATPSYQADEDSFRLQISQLKLPEFCEVQHSQAFETDEVFLSIRFRGMEQLCKSWSELNSVLQETKLHER